ncbi:unnamed protein product [Parnassius apollo]|uniref:(apollo) hypothetical protein n=1 Tax=Parnassius apollo TaxID=110799 RepID=A0A8S3WXA7_PARAO|nr:unnamed protein product [Parnassius apollo]
MAQNRQSLRLEQISAILEDEEEAFDETDNELGLEGDADTFWEPEHESNSELSDTEEPSTPTSSQSQYDLSTYYLDRDKSTKCNKTIPSQRVRQRSYNHLSGSKGAARDAKSKTDSFLLFFDESIIELVMKHTMMIHEKATGKRLQSVISATILSVAIIQRKFVIIVEL